MLYAIIYACTPVFKKFVLKLRGLQMLFGFGNEHVSGLTNL